MLPERLLPRTERNHEPWRVGHQWAIAGGRERADSPGHPQRSVDCCNRRSDEAERSAADSRDYARVLGAKVEFLARRTVLKL